MKSAVMAVACAAGAQAFVAPSAFNGAALTTSAKSSSAMKMSFESEIGAQAPLGFWDPLGLLADADQERFERLRYVEVKHGRIAMLAIAGHLTQQNTRLPGMLSNSANLSFADMPNGVAALSKIPPAGLAQIFGFIGFLELAVMKNVEGSFPGDFTIGGNPFASSWDAMSEETQNSKRAIELNNGRAAQMGILALMVHEELNNKPYIINDLLGASYNFN
uniref:Chloroplast light harvesting protein lhcf6 n=2 Tax=Saccharina TaxID=309357 RepID=Q2XU52_SACJA|nr:light harvesting protein lhcf6 [Saccharina latissima]ABB54384.1 chloroplast light harvesting protein lhcf6 [Saccharina japonica]